MVMTVFDKILEFPTRQNSLYRDSLCAFDDYVSAYGEDSRVSLKYGHTMRVASLSAKIAVSMDMPAEDVELAWLCGLLHDIGRFEQIRRFGTFNDSLSVNHAQLGVDVLRGDVEGLADGRLDRFLASRGDDELVMKVVGLHSGLYLPAGLDARTRLFCEIVRDADKVDIVRVFGSSGVESVLGLSSEDFANGLISDKAMVAFRQKRCLGPRDRECNLDGLVGVVCLPFEIVNEFAKDKLREAGDLMLLVKRPFGIAPEFKNCDTKAKWHEIAQGVTDE